MYYSPKFDKSQVEEHSTKQVSLYRKLLCPSAIENLIMFLLVLPNCMGGFNKTDDDIGNTLKKLSTALSGPAPAAI